MAKITIFSAQGAKTGEIDLDPAKLDITVRKGLLKEALIAYQASQRQGSHKTKDRGEVAGGGKKPWRQKGTGRARQGSTRSPQWVGGGRAHGPRPRDYAYQLPANQRRLALLSSVRWQLEQGRICAVEGFDDVKAPKTKAVAGFLAKAGLGGKGALLVSEANQLNLHKSARNIPKVSVSDRRSLTAGAILTHANLVFTKGALDALVKELA